jgi:tetratricopeptide (TPR) repeat protein
MPAIPNQDESALQLLVRAAKLAPTRADVLRLLAHTASQLGFFGDAVQAWERYLAVVPNDDAAARDRAFAMTALGDDTKSGIAGLQAYVRKHPGDAVGHFELGTAEAPTDTAAAAHELDRALALQPGLVAAHVARGLLHYRQGDNGAALPDFEFAAQHDPTNPLILDRLGQTYLALDRAADALPLLRKAAALAPRDSRIHLHLARALTATGDAAEAKQVLARVRELGADKSATPRPAGLVDFLGLSPEEQWARYRAGVERTVAKNPDNAEAQVRYLQLLLGDGKVEEAMAVPGKLAALHPSAALTAEAASALVAAEQYPAALHLLESGGTPAATLDFAIATFHISGAPAGLLALDRIPSSARDGDYHLARAEMLLAAGQDDHGELELALTNGPTRPDLYRQTALLLLSKQRTTDAHRLLKVGINVLPENAELQTFETNTAH